MKKLLFILSILLSLTLISKDVTAQTPTPTILEPGDIAIVRFDSVNNNFSFVSFKNINPGTQINFTDRGWDALNNRFDIDHSEYVLYWSLPITSEAIPAGKIITLNDISPMSLSTSGDQIFIYQINNLVQTILFGLNFEGNAVWQGNASGATTSALPPSINHITYPLITQVSVAVFEKDYGIYDKTKATAIQAGSSDKILAAIVNNGNWFTSDTAIPIEKSLFDMFTISPTSIEGLNFNVKSITFSKNVIIVLLISLCMFYIVIEAKRKNNQINKSISSNSRNDNK